MAGGEGSLEGRLGFHGQSAAGLCWAALTLCSLPSVHGLHRSPPLNALPGLQHSHPGHQVRPSCGGGGVWCAALCWELRVVDLATIPSPFPDWGAVLRRVRVIWGGAQSQLCPRLPVTHALQAPDDLHNLETTAHPSESVWVPRGVLRTPQHVLAPGGGGAAGSRLRLRAGLQGAGSPSKASRACPPSRLLFGAEKAW